MQIAVDFQAKTVRVTVPAAGPGTTEITETLTVDAMPPAEPGVMRMGWSDEELHAPTPAEGEPCEEARPGRGSIVRAGEQPDEEIHDAFFDRSLIEPYITAFDVERTRVKAAEVIEKAAATAAPIPTPAGFQR